MRPVSNISGINKGKRDSHKGMKKVAHRSARRKVKQKVQAGKVDAQGDLEFAPILTDRDVD